MKTSAPGAFCRKSGPSTVSYDTFAGQAIATGTGTSPSVLSPAREVVQTNAYTDIVSILEAPIALEPPGRT